MDPSVIINFGLLVVTGVATVAAIVQARVAQSAQAQAAEDRAEAEAAAKRAGNAAVASAAAGQRAADALERQVQLMEDQLSRASSLEVEGVSRKTYRVKNVSGTTMRATGLVSDLLRFGLVGPWAPPAELRNGQSFDLYLEDDASGVTQTFTMSWSSPGGRRDSESFTIMSYFDVPRTR